MTTDMLQVEMQEIREGLARLRARAEAATSWGDGAERGTPVAQYRDRVITYTDDAGHVMTLVGLLSVPEYSVCAARIPAGFILPPRWSAGSLSITLLHGEAVVRDAGSGDELLLQSGGSCTHSESAPDRSVYFPAATEAVFVMHPSAVECPYGCGCVEGILRCPTPRQ
jgi:hypothetical protein